jgi:transcriptional regulator with XRE-family HTH domain
MEPWVPEDTFGMRLRILRHELGLTVEDICEQCGVRPPTWGKWERGESEPRGVIRVINTLVEVTGVDREWLLWGGPLAPAPTKWYRPVAA